MVLLLLSKNLQCNFNFCANFSRLGTSLVSQLKWQFTKQEARRPKRNTAVILTSSHSLAYQIHFPWASGSEFWSKYRIEV